MRWGYKMKKCEKCGFEKEELKEKQGICFCDICFLFAPENLEKLSVYSKEKVSKDEIASFRKNAQRLGLRQKLAMIKKAKAGIPMSRAPFGYKIKSRDLVPAEYQREVEEIFTEFLNTAISLNRLSKKHSLSVNGLKKILTNFTYVGKIKFNGEIYEGHHEPIISTTLFNHVQNKIERLGIKRI